MCKFMEFLRRWWEQRKDRHGKYLVIYLDGETRHRFTFAEESKATWAYELLKTTITKTQKQGDKMIVSMYENYNIVRQYDTESNEEFRRQ